MNMYHSLSLKEDYKHKRVLGGGTVINAGFYSHAETEFVKESGLDEALVNDAYQWVENKVVFKAPLLQWQTAVRDGLLEAGVLPYNGFTNEHINGTKIGSTIFDMNDQRHSAADLLEYADPKNIIVYLHATVPKILFTTQSKLQYLACHGTQDLMVASSFKKLLVHSQEATLSFVAPIQMRPRR